MGCRVCLKRQEEVTMEVMIREKLSREVRQKRNGDDEDEDCEMKECLVRLGTSAFDELTDRDFDRIKALAERKTFGKGALIFAEGDAADNIYFIESGCVSVFLTKFADEQQIAELGSGEYFGEMSFFYDGKRTASVSALSDLSVLAMSRDAFLSLLRTDRSIAEKVNRMLARRKEEHRLKERLIDVTGMAGTSFHVSIKGDQSMKETVFARERYESVVDKVLPLLVPRLEDLLLNRCIYQVYVGFNNGEIRTSSVFDPFGEEIHQAGKIADEAYVNRQFPEVSFEEKTAMLRRLYEAIGSDPIFCGLRDNYRHMWRRYYEHWKPMPPETISNALVQLPALRDLPNYYLRNFMLGIIHDAIRMQFNCDGTHIVSSEDYQRFIDENV